MSAEPDVGRDEAGPGEADRIRAGSVEQRGRVLVHAAQTDVERDSHRTVTPRCSTAFGSPRRQIADITHTVLYRPTAPHTFQVVHYVLRWRSGSVRFLSA